MASISESLSAEDSPQGSWTMQNQITRTYQVEVTADGAKQSTHAATLNRIQVQMDDGVGLKDRFDYQEPAGSKMEPYFMPQIGGVTKVAYSPAFYAEEVEFEGKVAEEMMWLKKAEYTAKDWTLERRRLDAIYPPEAIKTGSNWQDQTTISSFYPVQLTRNFTVLGEKGGVLEITMEGKVRPPAARVPTNSTSERAAYSPPIPPSIWKAPPF